jgi:phage terminase small subunit
LSGGGSKFMARPCKSAKVLTECSQTKEEIQKRIENEEKLKGKSDNINPPDYLNSNQVDLFVSVKESTRSGSIT